VQHSGM